MRLKAAETDRSISTIVNDAVRRALAEVADHLAVFRERENEPPVAFQGVATAL